MPGFRKKPLHKSKGSHPALVGYNYSVVKKLRKLEIKPICPPNYGRKGTLGCISMELQGLQLLCLALYTVDSAGYGYVGYVFTKGLPLDHGAARPCPMATLLVPAQTASALYVTARSLPELPASSHGTSSCAREAVHHGTLLRL